MFVLCVFVCEGLCVRKGVCYVSVYVMVGM